MATRGIIGAGSVLLFATCVTTPAPAVVINFDVDASGNTIVAPTAFVRQHPLRTEYASLGVTFSGPAPLDGGAVLDQDANFGINGRSGRNFLAFNRSTAQVMLNGGVSLDPETLTFVTPLSSISIWASGGGSSNSFRMDAFTTAGTPVGTSAQSSAAGAYVQLSIPNPTQPIDRVVLTGTGSDTHFVYDDLEYTLIPEPLGVSASVLGLAAGELARRRRR